MVTCPWCGTSYVTFQPNCDNCGGTLPLPQGPTADPAASTLRVPPPPPRRVPRNYVWRLLMTDGWAITAGIFVLIGGIFGLVGGALTISIVAAFVGLPFVGVGLLLLVPGGLILVWRAGGAQTTAEVLRSGDAALGRIVSVDQNYHVQINGRFPWSLVYQFEAAGEPHEGKVTTLSQPDLSRQAGRPVYVLYARDDPERNTIYPHPYGYHGL